MQTIKEFEKHILIILRAHKLMLTRENIKVKKEHIQSARISYQKCVEHFQDKNKNIHRWLNDKPLVFKNPITEDLTETTIGKDIEALYFFLEFCRRQNSGESIDDDFAEYLEYLTRRSRYSTIWIEC